MVSDSSMLEKRVGVANHAKVTLNSPEPEPDGDLGG